MAYSFQPIGFDWLPNVSFFPTIGNSNGVTTANSAYSAYQYNGSRANSEYFGFGTNEYDREFNSAENAINRQFQADEAAKERAWSEYMRDTSFLSTAEQMEKAGFNPALAFMQGGAVAPGGASAAGSSASAGGSSIAGGLNVLHSAASLLGTSLVTKAITSKNSSAAQAFWRIVRFLK